MEFAQDLVGKVCAVTGASSGIGRHAALKLAQAGMAVALLARRQELLRELADEIKDAGGRALAVVADVTDRASVEQAFAASAREFAAEPAVLFNNAGITRQSPALATAEKDFDAVLDVDLKGVWTVAQCWARRLQAKKMAGSMINISSILGLAVAPELLPYSVAKAGVIQLTRALALELGPFQIRVNSIAPGYIETDMNRAFLASEGGARLARKIPLGRIGELEDLDGALLLLASDASRHMTGTVLPVDGGHLLVSL